MTEPFTTSSGLVAYRKFVPNRTALGLPMTAKGEGDFVSLAYVSILSERSDALSRRAGQ